MSGQCSNEFGGLSDELRFPLLLVHVKGSFIKYGYLLILKTRNSADGTRNQASGAEIELSTSRQPIRVAATGAVQRN